MTARSRRPQAPARSQPLETVRVERQPVPLGWVNTPLQDRSKKTLERILDATEGIIREHGVEAVTIPAVTRAAGSSVGSFYARFADKAALLNTLHERACEQSIATADAVLDPARWTDVTTPDLLRAFVAFAVGLFGQRRPMMLAFSSALGGDQSFGQRRARTAAAIGGTLRRLLLERRASIGHPTPEIAIDMALRLVTATLEQRNGFESTGTPEVSIADALLVDELTCVVLRYLDVADAGPPRSLLAAR